MAGLSKTTIGTIISSWCATPGAVIPTDPPTRSIAPAATPPAQPSPTSRPAAAPIPTPSVGAFEFWREDSCDDYGDCFSTIFGWEIRLPPANQVINPCKNSKYKYSYDFANIMQNDNSNYTITMTHIDGLNYDGWKYLGSNYGYRDGPNEVTGRLFPSDGDTNICCNPVPGAVATSCTDSHSIDDNNWTPVGYCLR